MKKNQIVLLLSLFLISFSTNAAKLKSTKSFSSSYLNELSKMSCQYSKKMTDTGMAPIVSSFKDSGTAAVGDTVKPQLSCNQNSVRCLSEIECVVPIIISNKPYPKAIMVNAICPAIEGRCPSNPMSCLDSNRLPINSSPLAAYEALNKSEPATQTITPVQPTTPGAGGR